jgi:hypothetical protein
MMHLLKSLLLLQHGLRRLVGSHAHQDGCLELTATLSHTHGFLEPSWLVGVGKLTKKNFSCTKCYHHCGRDTALLYL